MNTKVNKLVKIAAAGLFLIALAINVKVTMDDPFTMVTEQALATETGGTGTGGGDCTMSATCSGGMCIILNAKKNFLANGCKKKCDIVCVVQKWGLK